MKKLFEMLVNASPEPPIAIVGCTNASGETCYKRYHRNTKIFCTLDKNPSKRSDVVYNIMEPLPAELRNKFEITIAEGLPWPTFSGFANSLPGQHPILSEGVKNLLAMTTLNGFVLIYGCDRLKEYRFGLGELKYVELVSTKDVVLIPADQTMSMDALWNRFHAMSPSLQTAIRECCSNKSSEPLEEDGYCNVEYKTFPTGIGVCIVQEKIRELYAHIKMLGCETEKLSDENKGEVKAISRQLVADLQKNEDSLLYYSKGYLSQMSMLGELCDLIPVWQTRLHGAMGLGLLGICELRGTYCESFYNVAKNIIDLSAAQQLPILPDFDNAMQTLNKKNNPSSMTQNPFSMISNLARDFVAPEGVDEDAMPLQKKF